MRDLPQQQADSTPEEASVRRRFWQNPEIEESLSSYDVESSIAHVEMLAATGIIDRELGAQVVAALEQIKGELAEGRSFLGPADTDIHAGLERRLKASLGDAARVLHLAKSRNDQIATDIRLWLRDAVSDLLGDIMRMRKLLLSLAQRDLEVIMPGYTHMQPAQPIMLSHWWLAHEERLHGDFSRVCDFWPRLNRLPLGACVLAGTTEPIDRMMVAEKLQFDGVIENSLVAVSDRDFLLEFGSIAACIGTHISQLSSELLLWQTQEYGFVRLQTAFVFGSTRFPYKRNPELLEILRARPAALVGRLVEFAMQQKAMTIGFSQDLQECLPGLFDQVETLRFLLDLMHTLVAGIDINAQRMREIACADMVNGLSAIEYLLARGVDEDRAHKIVDQITSYCQARNRFLSDLELNEWQQFFPMFEADIYKSVTMEQSVGSYCSLGSSSLPQVTSALDRASTSLAADLVRVRSLRGLRQSALAIADGQPIGVSVRD